MKAVIEVKDLSLPGKRRPGHPDTICRTLQQAKGWEWVHYQGNAYQVFGGIRGPLFIDLCNPIRKRRRT